MCVGFFNITQNASQKIDNKTSYKLPSNIIQNNSQIHPKYIPNPP